MRRSSSSSSRRRRRARRKHRFLGTTTSVATTTTTTTTTATTATTTDLDLNRSFACGVMMSDSCCDCDPFMAAIGICYKAEEVRVDARVGVGPSGHQEPDRYTLGGGDRYDGVIELTPPDRGRGVEGGREEVHD